MSFTKLTMSQTKFLEKHLRGTGRHLSAEQASATFGIENLSARMSDLRAIGLRVRKTTNSSGKTAYTISRRDANGKQSKHFK